MSSGDDGTLLVWDTSNGVVRVCSVFYILEKYPGIIDYYKFQSFTA